MDKEIKQMLEEILADCKYRKEGTCTSRNKCPLQVYSVKVGEDYKLKKVYTRCDYDGPVS